MPSRAKGLRPDLRSRHKRPLSLSYEARRPTVVRSTSPIGLSLRRLPPERGRLPHDFEGLSGEGLDAQRRLFVDLVQWGERSVRQAGFSVGVGGVGPKPPAVAILLNLPGFPAVSVELGPDVHRIRELVVVPDAAEVRGHRDTVDESIDLSGSNEWGPAVARRSRKATCRVRRSLTRERL